MRIYILLIILALVIANTTKTAQAVPPPDFIFNIGSQIVQIFSFTTDLKGIEQDENRRMLPRNEMGRLDILDLESCFLV